MQAARKAAERPSIRAFWVIESPRPKGRTKPRLSLFFMIVILAAAVVILNLTQRALIAQNALQIESLKGRLKEVTYLNEKLVMQTASLKSPERIETIAREELGMVSPQQLGFIQMPEGLQEPPRASKASATLGQNLQTVFRNLATRLEDILISDSTQEAEAGIP